VFNLLFTDPYLEALVMGKYPFPDDFFVLSFVVKRLLCRIMFDTVHYFGTDKFLETSVASSRENCTWKQGVWFFPQGPVDVSTIDKVCLSVSHSIESRELFVAEFAVTTK
jgi:hypothetical protein